MPNYDFKKDLPIALRTEQEVATLLETKGNKIVGFNDNKDYDIKLVSRTGITRTVEVKEDFTCERTGNVGLEYSCRGRPSGISISKADFYVYKLHEPNKTINFYIFTTKTLKQMITDKLFFRTVNGGDEGSNSLNYLFKLDVFKSKGVKL